MSFKRSFDDFDRPAGEPVGGLIREERRERTVVAEATLACPACDAPVVPGESSLAVGAGIECPYCSHSGPVRDFLSLAAPARAVRVYIRASLPER